MEIVIVEKKTFEALLTAAGTLAEKVDALYRRYGDRKGCKWLDSEDVCRILRISPRTLRIMRDNRVIGFAQVNRKFYYKPEEVDRLLKGAVLQRCGREET